MIPLMGCDWGGVGGWIPLSIKRLLSFSAYVFILLETGPVATAVSLLRSTNASTHALARVEQRQQACDEGLRALKENT